MNLSQICRDQAFASVLASGSSDSISVIFALPNVTITLNLKPVQSWSYHHLVVYFFQTPEFAGKVALPQYQY